MELYCPKCPAQHCCEIANTKEGCTIEAAKKVMKQIPKVIDSAGMQETPQEGLAYIYQLLNNAEYNTAATIIILSFEEDERCSLIVNKALA